MKIKQGIARGISAIFHPLIIPTLAFLLFMNTGFYFSALSFDAKKIILLVVFLSTFLLPAISIALMNLNTRFKPDLEKSPDRVVPLLSAAVFYYVGYYALGQMNVFPVYRVFLISSILIIILLMLVSIRWKISAHMAGIGGLIGALAALSLRLGLNSSLILSILIVIAGLTGSSRLILAKHTTPQVYAGFLIGFSTNFLIIIYI